MKTLLLILTFLTLAGCVTAIPGQVHTHTSTFDGLQEVSMAPGWVSEDTPMGPTPFQLGLHWASASPQKVAFIAVIPLEIVNIESDEGLQFNIDGKIVKLNSAQAFTDFGNYAGGESSKYFGADLNLVRQILKADSVLVKLITQAGYIEGNLKSPTVMSAIGNMPEFLKTVEGYQ